MEAPCSRTPYKNITQKDQEIMVFYTKAINNRIARRSAIALLLTANALGAMADSSLKLTTASNRIVQGQEFEVQVLLNNEENVSGLQSYLVLSEGLTVVANELNKVYTFNESVFNTKFNKAEGVTNGGRVRSMLVGAVDMSAWVEANSNPQVATFRVVADKNFTGDASITLKNVVIEDVDQNTYKEGDKLDLQVITEDDVDPVFVLSSSEDSVMMMPSSERELQVILSNNVRVAGLDCYVSLPRGLELVDRFEPTERSNGYTIDQNVKVKGDSMVYHLMFHVFDDKVFNGNDGAVIKFKVKANTDLPEESYIYVFDALVSKKNGTDVEANDVKVKVINNGPKVKEAWDRKADALQEKLDSVMGTTPAEVRNDDKYGTFDPVLGDSTDAQKAIDDYKDKLDDLYGKGELTDENAVLDGLYDDADNKIDEIIETIRKQKELYDKYAKNDSVYGVLTPTGLQEAWDAADAELGGRDLDHLKDAFDGVMQAIQDEINGVENDIETRHNDILLDDAALAELQDTIQALKDRLQNLRANGEAAEQAHNDLKGVEQAYDDAIAAIADSLLTEPEVAAAIAAYEDSLAALKAKIEDGEKDGVEKIAYDYADELQHAQDAVEAVKAAAEEAQARLDYENAVKAVDAAYEEAVEAVGDAATTKQKVIDAIADADEAIAALKAKKAEAEADGGSYKALDYQDEYDEAMRRIALIRDAADVEEYDGKAGEALAATADDKVKVPAEVDADVTVEKQALQQARENLENAVVALDGKLGNGGIDAEKLAVDRALAALENALQALEDAVKQAADSHRDDGDATTTADLQTDLDNAVADAQALAISQELYDNMFKPLAEAAQDAVDAVGTFAADSTGKLTVPANADELDRLFDAARQAIQALKDKVEEVQQVLDKRDAMTSELNGLIENIDRRLFHCGEDILSEGYYAMEVLSAELDVIKDKRAKLREDIKEAYAELSLDSVKFNDFKGRIADINTDIDNWRKEMGSKQAAGQTEADKNKQELVDGRNGLNDEVEKLEDNLEALISNTDLDPESPEVKALKDKLDSVKQAVDKIDQAIQNAETSRKLLDEETLDKIRQQISDAEDILKEAEDAYTALQQSVTLPGDADGNGKVDGGDYVTMVNMYLKGTFPTQEDNPNEFRKLDVNGDNIINLGDITGVVNIILYGNYSGPVDARMVNSQNVQLMAETQMIGGKQRIALNLSGMNDFVACKLDLVLPDGVTIANVSTTDRTRKHSIADAELENGVHRIVISSASNRHISGNDGAMLYIDLEGTGNVEFQDVIFSDSHAATYELSVAAQETTGIAGARVNVDSQSSVYSLGGRVMNALKKGINIIRHADGSTQKVIK